MAQTKLIAEPGKHEIVLTGILDAPRERVFKAFTDPNLLVQWWGPRSLNLTIERMDVKACGMWRFVERDSKGIEYAFHGVYHSVLPPERLIYTFEFEGTPDHVYLETITFENLAGKTKLTDQSVFQTVEDRDAVFNAGMQARTSESMDRLAELLAKL